jgi:hypothetical protein
VKKPPPKKPPAALNPKPSNMQVEPVLYAFNGGGYKGVDPQKVGERLAAMEINPGDFHRTDDVVEEGKDPSSPLYGCFTHDVGKAAAKCWKHEARRVLRTISFVTFEHEKKELKQVYWHVRDSQGPRYVNQSRVATDAELKQKALTEALTLLSGLRRRFQLIEELQPVLSYIDDFVAGQQSKAGKSKKGGAKKK